MIAGTRAGMPKLGRGTRITAAEAALLVLVLAAPVRAAEVEVVADTCKEDACFEAASLFATPGERNRVTVSHDSAFVVTVTDRGAPLTAGDGCVALDAHSARCTADPDTLDGLGVKVWLGDGDDTAHVDRGTVYGGPGDDRLTGRSVRFTGGPGEDRLTATVAGAFTDGDGAHPARDVYRGAHASLSYAGRRHGMRIDLRAGRAGEDVLRGIRSVTGTRGADTIVGTDRRDSLDGYAGRDRIVALGGDDRVRLERGTVDAGAGDDDVDLYSGHARARCGPGSDRVYALGDTLIEGCERLSLSDLPDDPVRLHPVTAGVVLSGLGCRDCTRARYDAWAGAVLVARARLGARTLRLNRRGRRLLAARRRLVLTLRFSERSPAFGHDTSGFRTVVTPPRP
jgi:Ca2+-binding RTX toxin-like protein